MYNKYTGIILKKHPFGEADELLTIYTREAGKMRVKAVSVRKPLSKLAGHLGSLNEVEFETAGRRQNHLPVLISVRAITFNGYLRQNLRKFGYALVGVETLYRLTGDGQENGEAYSVLQRFLKDLGETLEENLALRRFQLDLLAASGYEFPVNRVIASGTPRGNPDEIASAFEYKGLAMTKDMEQEIDRFLDYVLEREIKSMKFLTEIS